MDATRAINNLRTKPLAACLLLPLATGIACNSIAAATLPVTNCNDAGGGSLRAALAIAHSGDSVDLTALTCGTISLATGELQIPVDDLALKGPGANSLTIAGSQAPGHHYAVLHHTGHGTLRVDALRVTDSNALYGVGHALDSRCVESSGTVYLNRSVITACGGGAVFANGFSASDSTISNSIQGIYTQDGDVSISGSSITGNAGGTCVGLRLGHWNAPHPAMALIRNSTISGNRVANYYGNGAAGCIYDRVTISNSTVAFNTAGYYAGGLVVNAAEVSAESSIFANNGWGDLIIAGATNVSGHNNLIMSSVPAPLLPADTIAEDPLLLPLADNGGPTWTHALASGSPAIDAGNNLAGLASDQRGSPFVRTAGARPDIGAFELQPAATASVSIGPGFTGSWFDPTQSGHGLMLEVLSDHRLLAMWFAFNPEGNQQSWFGGVGTYSGATATITDVALPTGGRWIPNFNPNAIVRNPWGTLTFTFTDCAHGRVDFNSVRGYGSGSMNLLRLTQPAGLTCP